MKHTARNHAHAKTSDSSARMTEMRRHGVPGPMIQSTLLIAGNDLNVRTRLAETFIHAGYDVMVTDSATHVLDSILKKTAQVVLLGNNFDDLKAQDLIPLLKRCNNNVTIILISDEDSLPSLRRLREEGIFYHALPPVKSEDWEEIRQVVQCALENVGRQKIPQRWN